MEKRAGNSTGGGGHNLGTEKFCPLIRGGKLDIKMELLSLSKKGDINLWSNKIWTVQTFFQRCNPLPGISPFGGGWGGGGGLDYPKLGCLNKELVLLHLRTTAFLLEGGVGSQKL